MLWATWFVRKVFEAVKLGSLRAGDGELRQVRALKNIFPFSLQFPHVSCRSLIIARDLEPFLGAPLVRWFCRVNSFWTFARKRRWACSNGEEQSSGLSHCHVLRKLSRKSCSTAWHFNEALRKWRAFNVFYSCTCSFPTKINSVRLFPKDHSIQRWLVARLCIYLFPCPSNCRTSLCRHRGERMIFIFFITHL